MKYKCEFIIAHTDYSKLKSEYNISDIYFTANNNLLMIISVYSDNNWKYININKITVLDKYEALTRFVIGQQIVWDKLKELLQGYLGIDPNIKSPFTKFEIELPWKNNLKQRLKKEIDKINRELNINKNKYEIKGE